MHDFIESLAEEIRDVILDDMDCHHDSSPPTGDCPGWHGVEYSLRNKEYTLLRVHGLLIKAYQAGHTRLADGLREYCEKL